MSPFSLVLLSSFLVVAALAPPQRKAPKELEPVALKLAAQRYNIPVEYLEVETSGTASYYYSGKQANVFTIGDKRNDNAYQVSLDDKGKALDEKKLGAEDLAARFAKYGKLWPDLWEKLKTASPDEDISVIISLDLGSDKDRPQDDDNTYETEEHFMKRLRAYNDAREKRVVEPVRRKLVQLGYEPFITSGGYVGLNVKPAVIKEIEKWPEVRMISLNGPDHPN
jgi:hypothetical protein